MEIFLVISKKSQIGFLITILITVHLHISPFHKLLSKHIFATNEFEHFKTKIGCPVKFASFQKDSEQRIPNAWLVREYKAGFKIHEIGS